MHFMRRANADVQKKKLQDPCWQLPLMGRAWHSTKETSEKKHAKQLKNADKRWGKRLSQGEKKNAKRMATVAAVYTTDSFERSPDDLVSESGPRIKKMKRPPIENKRVWASLEKEPEEVIKEAFTEAQNRDPNHEKKLGSIG